MDRTANEKFENSHVGFVTPTYYQKAESRL